MRFDHELIDRPSCEEGELKRRVLTRELCTSDKAVEVSDPSLSTACLPLMGSKKTCFVCVSRLEYNFRRKMPHNTLIHSSRMSLQL